MYEEENTLQRDSMYVIESYISPSSYDFNIRIQSSLTGYRYHYWPEYFPNSIGCSQTEPVGKRCLQIRRSKSKYQDHLGDNNCFFINFKINDYDFTGYSTLCSNNKIVFTQIEPSYSIKELNFTKTIVISETCSPHENSQPTKIFYSKNTGIIRKELLDSNQVWNLVKFHIEK